MDFQRDIVARYLGDEHGLDFLRRVNSVASEARQLGARVIYVRVAFRDGYPEVSPNNRRFSEVKRVGRLNLANDETSLHPALKVQKTDIAITKHRVGAFHGTDLEVILRSLGVTRLMVAGIATSGVVLSTVRHAADLDYRLAVIRDCCADTDQVLHDFLCDRVFPSQADVITSKELGSFVRVDQRVIRAPQD